jgi:hypothetical protein
MTSLTNATANTRSSNGWLLSHFSPDIAKFIADLNDLMDGEDFDIDSSFNAF